SGLGSGPVPLLDARSPCCVPAETAKIQRLTRARRQFPGPLFDNVVTPPVQAVRPLRREPARLGEARSAMHEPGAAGPGVRPPPTCPAHRPLIHGSPMTTHQTRWSQFLVLITVFFFWGFVAASNEILIPVFKNAFDLSQAQSQYVAVAFYVAYTVGSVISFLTSRALGADLLNRIGYKDGIAVGLLVSAVGTL